MPTSQGEKMRERHLSGTGNCTCRPNREMIRIRLYDHGALVNTVIHSLSMSLRSCCKCTYILFSLHFLRSPFATSWVARARSSLKTFLHPSLLITYTPIYPPLYASRKVACRIALIPKAIASSSVMSHRHSVSSMPKAKVLPDPTEKRSPLIRTTVLST